MCTHYLAAELYRICHLSNQIILPATNVIMRKICLSNPGYPSDLITFNPNTYILHTYACILKITYDPVHFDGFQLVTILDSSGNSFKAQP